MDLKCMISQVSRQLGFQRLKQMDVCIMLLTIVGEYIQMATMRFYPVHTQECLYMIFLTYQILKELVQLRYELLMVRINTHIMKVIDIFFRIILRNIQMILLQRLHLMMEQYIWQDKLLVYIKCLSQNLCIWIRRTETHWKIMTESISQVSRKLKRINQTHLL